MAGTVFIKLVLFFQIFLTAVWIRLGYSTIPRLRAYQRNLETHDTIKVGQCKSHRCNNNYITGMLRLFGNLTKLADLEAFTTYLAPLRKTNWVIYVKTPFGWPEAVLTYLSRYTHRVAISNHRFIRADANSVAFRWKDYRINMVIGRRLCRCPRMGSSAAF